MQFSIVADLLPTSIKRAMLVAIDISWLHTFPRRMEGICSNIEDFDYPQISVL